MSGQKEILLTPGPTPVPSEVLATMAQPVFHHRTPRYRKIFSSVSERIKKVFLTENPVYVIAGSGTSAMEASVSNFHNPGDEVLVVEGGKFGERFTHIANAFGLRPTVLSVKWGEAADPEKIRQILQNNSSIRSVFCQLCETSTAVLNDIEAIGKITGDTNVLLIVDAISGLGADRLETDKWNVDITVSASQKAMMLPPGLAFMSVSKKARSRMDSSMLPKFYVDLRLYEKGLKDADTPFTPATALVLGLQKVLDLIEAEGIENVFKRASDLGEYTRKRLEKMGLTLFPKAPSSTVSAAFLPEGIDGQKLVKVLRDEKGVSMAGGQGELKGKIVRIAHMGAITKDDLDQGLKVLEETLQEMKATSSKS